jgi:hypothetical protein
MNIHDATEIAYKNGYEKGKSNSAEEIFRDIERLMLPRALDNRKVLVIDEVDFEHLKKKYTESEGNP